MDQVWELLTNLLGENWKSGGYFLMILGFLVAFCTALDAVIPDSKDKGWFKKVLKVPILGSLLLFLKRFSPLNVKEEK